MTTKRICQTNFARNGLEIEGYARVVVDQLETRYRIRILPIPGVDEMGETFWSSSLEGARGEYRKARAWLAREGYQPVGA